MNAPETRRTLTTGRVAFLVIAAAAPMAALIGTLPLALIRGNGIAMPAAYVIAGAILLCFCAAYTAITRRISNEGALYLLVARTLGKPLGAATAYVAALGYSANAIGLPASFGYFSSLVLGGLGVSVPWWVGTAVAVGIVAVLGYRNVELSAKTLGVLMILEFTVLIVLSILIVHRIGASAFPLHAFSPAEVFGTSLGVSAMFAFTSFVGFESAAIYGEETRNPTRSIPRAAYLAVSIITVFYVLTSLILIGGAGGTHAPGLARRESGDFVFVLAQRFGGDLLYDATAVLLCTSILASYLALHNAGARYLFALGREAFLPRFLGRYHPTHFSPYLGSLTVSAVTVIVVTGLGIAGASPYLVIAAGLIGLGTLGIVSVQAVTALATLVFFWRRSDRNWFTGIVAPVLSFGGLTAGLVLAGVNYATLTGTNSVAVNLIPILLVVVALAGIGVALVIRRRKPALYRSFAASSLRQRNESTVSHPPVTYSRRYAIIGGGPSGMIMARALLKEGVPFDWFERHSDFGGIWDLENPGTPMYESAHFISSKFTSGFFGEPMPDSFPDYPNRRQILEYIRGFGRTWNLYDAVTFNANVVRAEPRGDGRWCVSLASGERHEYDGVIAAPGVTWHPAEVAFPGMSDFQGEIRHSVTYRSGSEFTGKRVVIVGGGNSGVDIACDAARYAANAFFSVRRGYRYIPKHIGGLPTDAVMAGILPPPRGLGLSTDLNTMLDTLVGDLTRFGLPAPDHDALTSHPIMNSQILHYLSHGDLIARPDIDHFTRDGVVFRDGTEEHADVVMLCTGYTYGLPFLDPEIITWQSGHPQLYLNVFSREHDSLAVLGFIEFADAAYRRFDEMAQLIVMDIRARETGEHREAIQALKASDTPDVRGGVHYVDSPRHTNYVESSTYQRYLAELRDRFDWPDLDDEFYDSVRNARTTTSDTSG